MLKKKINILFLLLFISFFLKNIAVANDLNNFNFNTIKYINKLKFYLPLEINKNLILININQKYSVLYFEFLSNKKLFNEIYNNKLAEKMLKNYLSKKFKYILPKVYNNYSIYLLFKLKTNLNKTKLIILKN